MIARKGIPAPLQVGKCWVVERTQSWMNGYGKLRRCTERHGLVVTRRLIQEARARYRWPNQPTTRRLK